MDPEFLNSVSSSSRRIYTEFHHIKPIDKGGFGRIYSAVSNIDLQTYAIKNVMINDKKFSKKECDNTFNELRILAQFNHRNIVRYHTAWIEQIDNTNLNENELLSLSLSSSSRTNESESSDNLCSIKNKETKIDEDYSFNACSNEEFMNSSNSGMHENHGIPDSEKGSNNGVNNVDFALYIQMELCQLNLKDWIFTRNELPGDLLLSDKMNVQSLAQQLLEGVAYIHTNKVMHRDIKPANIFLNKHASHDDLQLKIGDFGLSKIFEYDIIEEMSTPSNFKWTANVGTPFYSAPEVMNSEDKATTYNHKCDLYSVGIIIVELMAKFKTFSELFHAITDLSNGRMLDELKEMWPLEAPHIMDLTSIHPVRRPEANFILNETLSFIKFH